MKSDVNFLWPTTPKLLWTGAAFILLFSTLLLRLLPPSIDILDLREIPGFVLILLGRIPITLFNVLTFSRYTSQGEGFLVFPSWQQLLFALIFDILLIYGLVCVILYGLKKKSGQHFPIN